jgi:hypothetical protein
MLDISKITSKINKFIFLNKIIWLIFVILFIFLIILGGIMVRAFGGKYNTIAEDTLTPYYFDKFQRVVYTGSFPQKDIWEWAPAVFPENTPPGIAYIAGAFFILLKKLGLNFKLIDFANIFPILSFILWCITIFFLRLWQKKNIDEVIILLAIIAFTPVSISLTSFANFTQETIGVLFLFLSLYLFSILKPELEHIMLTIITITILILTWQQFPIFYFVITPTILLALKDILKQKANIKQTLNIFLIQFIVLILPLVFSEAIVKLFIKNSYSAFSMIKEFILGFWLGFKKDPVMIAAMVRGNWRRMDLGEIYNIFGPLFILLLLSGFIFSIIKRGELKYRLALFATIIGALLLFQFEKEKNLAFGLFLFPIALMTEAIFNGSIIESATKIIDELKRKNLKIYVISSTFLLLIFCAWYFLRKVPEGIALITKYYPPKPEIILSSTKNIDGTVDINLRMINHGGTTFHSDRLWYGLNSGMHIAICNADIIKSSASSPTSEYVWRHFAVYPYARWGDCYFVEVKFKQLRKNQYGDAFFTIRPTKKAVKPLLYYRGWMTETSCIIKYKEAYLDTEEETKLVQSEGEPCIIRTPLNEEISKPFCPVQVMAARINLQNFRCHKVEL